MTESEIFVKTDAGADEVRARSRKLPPRLRTMLIMVDGTLSAQQLQQAAATLGVQGDFLQTLLEQGLIRRREAAQAAERSVDLNLSMPQPQVPAPAPAPAGAAPQEPGAGLSEGERFLAAQKFMNDSAVDALGLMSFMFTLKLEKCFTLTDLRNLLPDYARAIAKKSGETAAQVLVQRARQLLG